jgi:hypothetical protein
MPVRVSRPSTLSTLRAATSSFCRVACNFVNAYNLATFEFGVDAPKFRSCWFSGMRLAARSRRLRRRSRTGGAPRPFAFAGRRAGAGGYLRTRRFAGEGNTRKRPSKRRVLKTATPILNALSIRDA